MIFRRQFSDRPECSRGLLSLPALCHDEYGAAAATV